VFATDSTSLVAAMQNSAARIVLVPEGTYDIRRFQNAATTAAASGWTWCTRKCASTDANPNNTYYRINFAANTCGTDETIVKASDNLRSWSRWITTKPNKTLVGMGRGASLRGASLYMRSAEGASNQIYRNLAIYDVNPHLIEAGDGLSIVGGATNSVLFHPVDANTSVLVEYQGSLTETDKARFDIAYELRV
jgi:pectate lyase